MKKPDSANYFGDEIFDICPNFCALYGTATKL